MRRAAWGQQEGAQPIDDGSAGLLLPIHYCPDRTPLLWGALSTMMLCGLLVRPLVPYARFRGDDRDRGNNEPEQTAADLFDISVGEKAYVGVIGLN